LQRTARELHGCNGTSGDSCVRDVARRVVDAYITHSRIFQNDFDPPYAVGPVLIDSANAEPFSRALHSSYSGLNDLELRFARALDRTQRAWVRNPKGGGFHIPLLSLGGATTFWPDFLVWVDKTVVTIDTKGNHLLHEASSSKLFEIDTLGEAAKVTLRLVSEGKSEARGNGQIAKVAKHGFTVWNWKNGKLNAAHAEDERAAVKLALQPG
jgi:type III restriction enzyme